MKFMANWGTLVLVAGTLALGACANITPVTPPPVSDTAYSGYGVVQSIELVSEAATGIAGSGIGAGTIAGAVVGGIVGSQVGDGQGKTAAMVLGAAGGAYVGHELEKRNQQAVQGYKFTIRMDNGSSQTVTQTVNADIRVGERVRIVNGVVQRY